MTAVSGPPETCPYCLREVEVQDYRFVEHPAHLEQYPGHTSKVCAGSGTYYPGRVGRRRSD